MHYSNLNLELVLSAYCIVVLNGLSFSYASTYKGLRIILAPNIEDVNNVAATQGHAGVVGAAQGYPVAGDAAEGIAVAGDAGVAVAGHAIAADPAEGIDEDADEVVLDSCLT
jgi:hypothetical protein